MNSPAFDHSPYHLTDDYNLQSSDLNIVPDLHDHNNLLDDPNLGIHHNSPETVSIEVYEPCHLHNFSESQHLADSYSEFDAITTGQHPQPFDHDHFLTDSSANHILQRSGTANFTPSSTADISKNKEVTFKDTDGHEHQGTVMDVHSDDTYKIQTSDGTYENVAYHDILKYGSK